MCKSCEIIIDGVWNSLEKNQMYKTPDDMQGATYEISEVEEEHIKINPQNIIINKQAFLETIHYLKTNNHDKSNSVKIQSSNDPIMSGPLCKISREKNDNVRCINYIIPILYKHKIVGIKSTKPNKTWIV